MCVVRGTVALSAGCLKTSRVVAFHVACGVGSALSRTPPLTTPRCPSAPSRRADEAHTAASMFALINARPISIEGSAFHDSTITFPFSLIQYKIFNRLSFISSQSSSVLSFIPPQTFRAPKRTTPVLVSTLRGIRRDGWRTSPPQSRSRAPDSPRDTEHRLTAAAHVGLLLHHDHASARTALKIRYLLDNTPCPSRYYSSLLKHKYDIKAGFVMEINRGSDSEPPRAPVIATRAHVTAGGRRARPHRALTHTSEIRSAIASSV
ncbi:hypothetical protein EVAR_47288_1 [Eumeta japonica]|uniref:Uncharacterized protein n=1 Tax=Eumeta variegata TaxID=151549 RepID=A0A4C1Z0S3_EUMVA|nr:hypothetical protein EVAR_47288_1 [Eumeta japonica]